MYIRALAAIAVRQHGLITRDQALECLGPSRLERWFGAGHLERVRPGVYRLAGASPTWQHTLLAAVLASQPDSVASHRSAAVLHGLVDRVGPPELTVPSPRWVRLPNARVHRTNCLPPEHVTVVDGIPVTTLVRTVFDLSAVVHHERLGQLLDKGRRLQPSLLDDMELCLKTVRARGRRRTTIMREVLALRHGEEHPGDSNWELGMVRGLRAANLGRLVQQHKVVVGDRTYYLDAAFPDEKVAYEFDTFATHGSRTSFDNDRRRDADLQVAGWLILRATSTTPPDQVAATARAALRLRRADGAHSGPDRDKVGG